MKKNVILLLLTLSAAICVVADDSADAIQEDVNFYLSFDGSVEADRTNGAVKPANISNLKNPEYAPGVSGKALLSKNQRIVLTFKRENILDFEHPGSVSIWIKPVKWLHPKDMPVDEKTGFRKTLCQNFFLTNYSKNGYLGFERLTSPHLDHHARILLFFANLKGIKANCSSYINWGTEKDKWHNIVITWSPMSFKMYFDGEFKAETTLQRALANSELSDYFTIECPAETIIDEFIIYSKALSQEQVSRFYQILSKGMK